MIIGVGFDAVDVERVERMLVSKGARALRRLFTEREVAYATQRPKPAQHLAARIAAKEAAFKAFSGSAEARAIGWREIEVAHDVDGRPILDLNGRALARASELGVTRVWISLTHTDGVAGAMVVLEGA